MPIQSFLLLFYLLAITISAGCNNFPKCFVKKLFDFSYPAEDVYSIRMNQNAIDYQIKAYGDFNNDLRTDYAALTNDGTILVFLYDINEGFFKLMSSIPLGTITPINLYLYDANGDNYLDITVWGQDGTNNVMFPLLRQNQTFVQPTGFIPLTIPLTTQPTIFEILTNSFGTNVGVVNLLIYITSQSKRFSYLYANGQTQYSNQTWASLFDDQSYESVPFSNRHWNTFIDITNDCFSDLILTNSNDQVQFWVYIDSRKIFSLSKNILIQDLLNAGTLTSLNLADVNYDGTPDLAVSNETHLLIYLNSQSLYSTSTFCALNSYTFSFQLNSPHITPFLSQVRPQNIQFGDINIDGYIDLTYVCLNSQNNKVLIVMMNDFQSSQSFIPFDRYNQKVGGFISSTADILSVSFLDVIENGVLDFIIVINNNGVVSTLCLYNNYLYQNSFFIKAYATNGRSTAAGTPIPGPSFYWMNSLGNNQRIAFGAQIISASYDAMPIPYVLLGLGKANNYVQMFTIGRLGRPRQWSPIIPNSQLAIFSGASDASSWAIKIFVLPTQSLIEVIVVCLIVLVILGVALLALKCKKKQQQQILLDYM